MASTTAMRGLQGLVVAVVAFYLGWHVDARTPRFALNAFRLGTLPPPVEPGQVQRSRYTDGTLAPELVIVDVMKDKENTVDEATLARVVKRAKELGAHVIGLDIVFGADKPRPRLDELKAAIQAAGNVVMASKYEVPTGDVHGAVEVLSCCGLPETARALGIANIRRDQIDDGLFRMAHIYDVKGIRTKHSLSLELALRHLGTPEKPATVESNGHALILKSDTETRTIPTDPSGYSLVPYVGSGGSVPSISYEKLLGKDAPPLDGKVALLGGSRTDILDAYSTPFHGDLSAKIAGTELLAQSFLGIVNSDQYAYPYIASNFTQNLLTGGVILIALLAAGLLSFPVAMAVLTVVLALIWVNTYQAYQMTGMVVTPLGASVALVFAGVATLLGRAVSIQSERRKLEGLMETYFEEELVPGAAGGHTESQLVDRLLAAKDQLAPPGMVIDGHLGAGGMSVVLAAHVKASGAEVALKLLSPALFRDEESRHRFRREAETAASIAHVNVVGVVASGNRLGFLFMPYIAYERVRGPTLRALLAKEGRFTPGRAAAITIQVLAGLAAAHEKNIIHRDVKPENVIITPEGVVKVLDFGIARVAEADDGFRTRTGIVLGTPAYMAPEVVRGQQASPSADLYATGTMFYELITGQPPFAMENVSATLVAHLEKEPAPPSQLGVEIPRALEAALMSLLAKKPDQRPADALAAIELLTDFASSIVGPSMPIEEGTKSHSTSATRAVKPSLAASGTMQVLTGKENRLSSARVLTPRRGDQPTLDGEAPVIHSAPTASYGDEVAGALTKKDTPPRVRPRTKS